MKRLIQFYYTKQHEFMASFFDGRLNLSVQWRGWEATDLGDDPLMLAVCFRSRQRVFHRYLVKPRMEIHYTARLSLALQYKDYWCDVPYYQLYFLSRS